MLNEGNAGTTDFTVPTFVGIDFLMHILGKLNHCSHYFFWAPAALFALVQTGLYYAPYALNLTSPAPAFAQTTPQRYASATGTARFSKS
jgi:hypothetical protein